jgi:DNA-binding GntR family transcriptional regulator
MHRTQNTNGTNSLHNGGVSTFNTRAQGVASELRRLILAGELRPGAHLRQAEIAGRFGVSTTPVREAFRSLEREGLVTQDPHRGVVVFEPSVADLRENYDIRIALESEATRIAADRLSQEELAHLDALVAQMHSNILERTPYDTLNHELHMTIYAAADRPRLFGLIADLRGAASVYLRLAGSYARTEHQRDIEAEHEAIVRALHAHDGATAADAMRAHLEYTARFSIYAVQQMLAASGLAAADAPAS